MTHGSLFSGIGGFDLASEWMGWENLFHCENNPFGQKILNHYWPNAELFKDIKKSNFTKYANKIDILTGGFPCQPYSFAGKRLGKEDDRHLWPEMLRAIREIKPSWIVGENVRGLINWNEGLVFDEVQSNLEAEGYKVTPFLLPAASVNAPHRRDRIWFIAYSDNKRRGNEFGKIQTKDGEIPQWNNNAKSSNSDKKFNDNIECQFGFYTCKNRQIEFCESCEEGSNYEWNYASNSDSEMLECRNREGKTIESTNKKERVKSFDGPRKWETFPTVSPICDGDDGLSNRLDGITFPKWRNESIKAGGNAIVPQVAYQIFKAIEEYERINNTKTNNEMA